MLIRLTRRRFLRQSSLLASASLASRGLHAQTGAPHGSPDAYAIPKPDVGGPFKPTWASIRDLHRTPAWFNQAKFGIFIHWGLYSIPARINEWYERHMYTTDAAWHTEHYGPPDRFGYKDFIPLFTAKQYDPNAWVSLFKSAGAKYVVPVAEHHDGFAMWDSDITPWCAGKMGPKRDLTGELAVAARKQNLIFGLSNHRMEHHTFAYPAAGIPNDQFDPRYAGFYGPPIPGEMNDGNASEAFQMDWLARVQEQIDKYQPQLIYFDNGVNPRSYDAIKLRAAAYYFNRAHTWSSEVTIASKDWAFLAGSVQDFEKASRSPRWIYPYSWQTDDALGSTWGYTESPRAETYRSAASVVSQLIQNSSYGGNLLLNISPRGDGSIPEAQQKTLLAIGEWLSINGEGIYGSRPWHTPGEGPGTPTECPPDWKGGSTDDARNAIHDGTAPHEAFTEESFRFTAVDGKLYAFGFVYPHATDTGEQRIARVKTLSQSLAKVGHVTLLGQSHRPLSFTQTSDALEVSLPHEPPLDGMPYALRIDGLEAL